MASPSSVLTLGLGAWGAALLVTIGFGSSARFSPTALTVTAEDRITNMRGENRILTIAGEDRIKVRGYNA